VAGDSSVAEAEAEAKHQQNLLNIAIPSTPISQSVSLYILLLRISGIGSMPRSIFWEMCH
jgi:hypothetical protein